MLESFLKLLKGETISEIVWTADLNYWMDGQRHAGKRRADQCAEKDYLELCRDLECMPYYWYEKFWLSEPEYEGVEVVTDDDGRRRRMIWKTPVGQIWDENVFMAESVSEACTKRAVTTESDLKILLYILEHRRMKPAVVDIYPERMKLWVAYDGLPCLGMRRGPLASFLYEWAGISNGIYLIHDHPELVREILDLMDEQEGPAVEAACRLAPPLVHFADNLSSSNVTGFFDEFMAQRYRQRLAAFHSAGTACAVHLDGTVKGLLPRLAEVGMDAIEALTPFPSGDLGVEEMRSVARNDKVILWGGVPGAMFAPPFTWRDMETHLEKLVASWSGTPFVISVADQVPPNGDIEMVRKISEFLRKY